MPLKVETITSAEYLTDIIGDKWAGEFTIPMLHQQEALLIGNIMIDVARKEKKDIQEFTDLDWQLAAFHEYVRFNGKRLPKDTKKIPSKLFTALFQKFQRLNFLAPDEGNKLFLPSSTEDNQ